MTVVDGYSCFWESNSKRDLEVFNAFETGKTSKKSILKYRFSH